MSKTSTAIVGRRLRRVLGALLAAGFGATWWSLVPPAAAQSGNDVGVVVQPKVATAKVVDRSPVHTRIVLLPLPIVVAQPVKPPVATRSTPPRFRFARPPPARRPTPPRVVVEPRIVKPVAEPPPRVEPPIIVDLPPITDTPPIPQVDDQPEVVRDVPRLPRIRTRPS